MLKGNLSFLEAFIMGQNSFKNKSVLQEEPPKEQPPKEKELPFVAQYLISTFSFSADRAVKVSAHPTLAAIKSPARPQAVVKFLLDVALQHHSGPRECPSSPNPL